MSTEDIIREIGLIQISDSFFPSGLYSTSNGLESLFLQKKISTSAELVKLISVQIEHQVGPSDCVALANTVQLAERKSIGAILELDRTVFAMRGVRDMREASRRSGVQLLKTIRQTLPANVVLDKYFDSLESGTTPGMHPVSFGVCCNALGIDVKRSLLSFLYGFTVSMVGAALRLGIIQHVEGQQTIHQVKPVIADAVNANCDKDASEMWQFSPQMEIYQMQHGLSDSRMFIT